MLTASQCSLPSVAELLHNVWLRTLLFCLLGFLSQSYMFDTSFFKEEKDGHLSIILTTKQQYCHCISTM